MRATVAGALETAAASRRGKLLPADLGAAADRFVRLDLSSSAAMMEEKPSARIHPVQVHVARTAARAMTRTAGRRWDLDHR